MIWTEVASLLKSCNGINLHSLSILTSSEVIHYPLSSVTKPAPPIVLETDKLVELPPVPPIPENKKEIINSISYTVDTPKIQKNKITTSKTSIDPICLGIEVVEPLYIGAPRASQKAIEINTAQKLETQLSDLYKSACGRSRGWTKVGLESMLKPRCASGGDLKELDRAKKGFIWCLATEDKLLSAFLDFICCAKRIRCVIMNNEKKTAHLYPAADSLDDDGKTVDYPIYFVDTHGHKINGLHNAEDLLTYVERQGWVLQPPTSVTHSLSGLTLDELTSVSNKLGMRALSGKKADMVAAIAAFKTRLRLTSYRDLPNLITLEN